MMVDFSKKMYHLQKISKLFFDFTGTRSVLTFYIV